MLTKVLLGLIALMLMTAPAFAQETRDLTDGGTDAGTSAFVTPPTGYTVIYHFIGARTSTTIGSSVHCSNLLGPLTYVRVEAYTYSGGLTGSAVLPISPYSTSTYVIGVQPPDLYIPDVRIDPPLYLSQGIIRVLKKGTGRIVCTAQIHDTAHTFVHSLTQFGPTGLH